MEWDRKAGNYEKYVPAFSVGRSFVSSFVTRATRSARAAIADDPKPARAGGSLRHLMRKRKRQLATRITTRELASTGNGRHARAGVGGVCKTSRIRARSGRHGRECKALVD